MAITSVNIIVPPSGDGPAANISSLVGAKTVILSGTYRGSFTILGSHGGTFVPIATFNSDGEDPIVQTLPISVAFVKVRTNSTTSQLTPVKVTVSGIVGVGVNQFGTLAVIPAGFSGPLPVIDTSILFPPTGLESDINIICAGSILGTILVEGSQDAVSFNPIGVFQAGQQSRPLLGVQQILEFEPLPTADKTRYIRINIQGQVFDNTTLTIGGSIPVLGPSTTTLSDAYDNGTTSSDQTLALSDTHGGGVVVDGTAVGFTGVNSLSVKSVAGFVNFPRIGGMTVDGNAIFNNDVGVGLVTPTARLHLAGVATAAGTASLKIDPGTLLTVTESGAIESDGIHLYWTDMGGTRWQLDGGGGGGPGTIAQTYAAGANAADQTMGLLDIRGGGVTINATNVGFTGLVALTIETLNSGSTTFPSVGGITTNGGGIAIDATGPSFFGVAALGIVNPNAGSVAFPVVGGLTIASSIPVPAALSATWNEIDLANSTVTLTGGPTTVTSLAMVHVGSATIDGVGNTVSDAYNQLVDADPSGTATLTRAWSAGFKGSVQANAGLVLGASLAPPGESDLVVGAGGTVVSEANSGRLGYIAGATQKFVVSQNGAAYVPLLTSVTLAQAYGFGTVAVDQTLPLLDANGGGFIVDGSAVGFTGTDVLSVKAASAGTVLFPRVGGLSAVSSVSVAAAAGSTWNEIDFQTSTITLTGGPAVVTKVAMVHVGQGVVNGVGNTVTDAYNQLVDVAPAGTATLTRAWSVGFMGAVQAQAGLVLGTALDPPTENDLVFGAGATVVSQVNSGRLGYRVATQDFAISTNTGAYVPLLVGPAAGGFTAGSVPFGIVGGQLSQDNTNFFWQAANATLQLGGVGALASSTLRVLATKSVVSAAGSTWDGISLAASTLTLTGATTPVTALSFMTIAAPTISAASAITVQTAATLTIAGAPIGAGVGPATITTPLALLVSSGNVEFLGNVGVGKVPATPLDVLGSANGSIAIQVKNGTSGTNAVGEIIAVNAANLTAQFGISSALYTGNAAIGASSGYAFTTATNGFAIVCTNAASTIRFALGTGTPEAGRFTANLNLLLGTTSDLTASKLQIVASKSVVAAAGAVWDGVNFAASTLTLTGATTPITTLNFVTIAAPTITAASAVVTTDFFTCRISAATFTGAGPASATRNWSLGIDGNTKFSGGQNINGTDINVAGPYTVLATDYVLEVRRTATAAISLNLPSIATVGNGHIVISKDSGYNAAVNNITLVRNGADTIENVAGNYVQNVSGSAIWLKANATTNNWEII